MSGLYVHVPFCVQKCAYCDFYSLPSRLDSIGSYVQAVLTEAEKYACHSEDTKYLKNLAPIPSFPSAQTPSNTSSPSFLRRDLKRELYRQNQSFDTLYLGGGTPSLLGAKNLTALVEGLSKTFNLLVLFESSTKYFRRLSDLEESRRSLPTAVERDMVQQSKCTPPCGREPERGVSTLGLAESTIEVNPESADPAFLQAVKTLGFNRVSFGVQSLSDYELKSVGRIHTAAQAINAIKQAQKLGFQAISADLMIGLPGQTWPSLRASLDTLVKMGIQHLSVYCLSMEEGTNLANNPPPDLPSDETQAQLFEEARGFLLQCGYAHYEISNFALPGFACLHNLNYWRGGEYLGLGPAAASHLDGKRFRNKSNLDAYLNNPTEQIEYVEELGKKEKAAEEAMLRLRLLEEGLDTIELAAKFGMENVLELTGRLEKLASEGLLIKNGSNYRLTPSRIMTSNPIFTRVLAD